MTKHGNLTDIAPYLLYCPKIAFTIYYLSLLQGRPGHLRQPLPGVLSAGVRSQELPRGLPGAAPALSAPALPGAHDRNDGKRLHDRCHRI